MAEFRWLHFTDLHTGMDGFKNRWPSIRKALMDDLAKLHDKCGPWNAIFFTGDLVNQGTTDEFNYLDEVVLEEIMGELKKLGSEPVLLAVPGNHDLFRPQNNSPELQVLTRWDQHSEIQREFWTNKNSKYQESIQKAFENYNQWWKKWVSSHNAVHLNTGVIPGDFSCTLEVNGIRVGVLGINTATLQLTSENYKNKLAIDISQFNQVCNGDGPKWVDQHHFCILLTHHGLDWLDNESKKQLEIEINPPGRFALHLFGHMHESHHSDSSVQGGEIVRLRQGPSLFGLDYYINDEKNTMSRTHGYLAGVITITGNGANIREWPRIQADEKQRKKWVLIPNNAGYDLEEDGGTKPKKLEYKNLNCSMPDHKDVQQNEDHGKCQDITNKVAINNRQSKEDQLHSTSTEDSTQNLPNSSNPCIVIVGSGFSGTVTAIRVLEFAREKLNLVILQCP